MGGFPTRANRAAYGPTREDYKPVTDPIRQNSAADFNLAYWQLAGLGRVTPRAVLRCTVSGGAVTTVDQLLSWDADAGLSALTWTYQGVGAYEFAFSSQYPDELGSNVTLSLIAGVAAQIPTKATDRDGAHDGGAASPTLDDSGQSWTVNGLVGCIVNNLTDGCWGIVTANTANQCTFGGGLAGGTGNDFDPGDLYVISDPPHLMRVQLTSNVGGYVLCSDEDGDLVDPEGFLLIVW
jgi:hypothetical protein